MRTKSSSYSHSSMGRLALVVAALLMAALLALPPIAAEEVKPPRQDNKLELLSFKVTPKRLKKNRINFLTADWELAADKRKLMGGKLSITYYDSRGKSKLLEYHLEDKQYKKNKGKYSFSFGLLPGNWKWIDIRLVRIKDGKDKFNAFSQNIRLKRANKIRGGTQGNKLGMKAFDFSLLDPDGNKVTLSDFKGKVVLIDFSTMWCGPCQTEAAGLKELYDKYHEQGLEILSVFPQGYNYWNPSKEDLKRWARKYKLKFPVLCDPFESVYIAYYGDPGERYVPYNFIIGPKGKLHYRKAGYTPEIHTEIENKIVELLGLATP